MGTRDCTIEGRSATPGPTPDAHGGRNHCSDDCVRPTPSQAHCGARGCHRTFGGVRGFDEHRHGGHCLDPAALGMALSPLGVWRTPMSEDARERLEATRG